jgi:tetratricopeptide (TPR) repeat protein
MSASLPEATKRINVFFSYASEDKKLRDQLDKHLSMLRRQGLIASWYDEEIGAGEEREREIAEHLKAAHLVLLLVSPDFLASDSCYSQEMEEAVKRHETSVAHVIPILLRPTEGWEHAPFGKLQPLPINGKPVSDWSNRDTALSTIARGIRSAIEKLDTKEPQPRSNYRYVVDDPPLNDPRIILQRESLVGAISTRLSQQDITALILTGIGGGGKSTLASLVYATVEQQRTVGTGLFRGETLWFQLGPTVTIVDVIGTLYEVLGMPIPDFRNSTAQDLALELITLLQTAPERRLIIIDQLEEWLDPQTGSARLDRPGVDEWIALLNRRPCICRILLTSRFWPHGFHEEASIYMQEFPIGRLTNLEGVALLRLWGIGAQETDLLLAVERCAGHALALNLLRAILKDDHSITLLTFFHHPLYKLQLTEDMARRLLNYIYTHQLHLVQRTLLGAFAVYREPVPLEAAQGLVETQISITKRQVATALRVLLRQHLLHAAGNLRYTVPPVIIDFAWEHIAEGDEQANVAALRYMHISAAHYYRRQAMLRYLPRGQRRKIQDVHMFTEAIWHYCNAGQQQEAYTLMMQEGIFFDMFRWGGNAILLELYLFLLPSKEWQPESRKAARIYNEVGELYKATGQLRQAQQYFEQALDLFRTLGEQGGEVNVLNNLGAVWRAQGQIKDSLDCYQKANSLYDKTEEEITGRGTTLNNLGYAYYTLGQQEQKRRYREQAHAYYEQASKYCEQALSLHMESREESSTGEEARTLNNLGKIARALNRKEAAREYHRQALRLAQEIGDRWIEALALNDAGLLAKDIGEIELALQYCGRAWQIFHTIGTRLDEARILRNLGPIFLLLPQKRYDVTLACFLLARTIFNELQSSERGGIPLWVLEELQLALGEQQSADLRANIEKRAAQVVEQTLEAML